MSKVINFSAALKTRRDGRVYENAEGDMVTMPVVLEGMSKFSWRQVARMVQQLELLKLYNEAERLRPLCSSGGEVDVSRDYESRDLLQRLNEWWLSQEEIKIVRQLRDDLQAS